MAAINEYKLGMLQLMLKDPKIKSCIIMDGAYAGEVKVTKEGNVLLGRTRCGWINRIFNQYDKIDFFTLANKIAVIVTGKNTIGGDPNDLRDMVWEIVNNVIASDDKEKVIELLFFYLTLMCSDSPFKSRYIDVEVPTTKGKGIKSSYYRTTGKATAYMDLGTGEGIPIDLIFDSGPIRTK